MGRVFLAFTPGGQAVAIKVIKPDLARDSQFAERFAREVHTAQYVRGIHVAQLLDADAEAREPWLASAYVAGPSLYDLVSTSGPLMANDILVIATGIARALESIHNAGVVHRDLKPANIMLDEAGPKVIDFGIVKSLATTSATHSSATRIGTLPYMSPEQALGRAVAPASDVFALGSTIYFLGTGQLAFDAENGVAMAYRIVNDEPDLLVLDQRLRELVRSCLQKDPGKRPAPAQVIEACQAELGETPPGAYMQISQATSAIRARTRALRELADGSPAEVLSTAFSEHAATVPPADQYGQETVTMRNPPERQGGGSNGPGGVASTDQRRRSRLRAAGVLAGAGSLAALAIFLPIMLSPKTGSGDSLATGTPSVIRSWAPTTTPASLDSDQFRCTKPLRSRSVCFSAFSVQRISWQARDGHAKLQDLHLVDAKLKTGT